MKFNLSKINLEEFFGCVEATNTTQMKSKFCKNLIKGFIVSLAIFFKNEPRFCKL